MATLNVYHICRSSIQLIHFPHTVLHQDCKRANDRRQKKVLCYRVRECVWLLQALCLHAISFFTHISFSIKVSVMYSRNLRIDGQPFLMLLLSKVSTTLQRVENERSRRSHSSRLSSLIHNYFIPCIRLIEIFFHDLSTNFYFNRERRFFFLINLAFCIFIDNFYRTLQLLTNSIKAINCLNKSLLNLPPLINDKTAQYRMTEYLQAFHYISWKKNRM